jgi:ubiquinone/menaquinone biosynthesis C-methylase UbiE
MAVQYMMGDVTDKIDFPPGSVDLIIDKGLMDAILCGEGFFERVKKYLSEAWRVLKARGTLMVLSQGHPDTRVLYLKNKAFPFALNIQEIKKVQIPSFATLDDLHYHYLYICSKQQL